MNSTIVRKIDSDEIVALTARLRSLYMDAYSVPPYNEGAEQANEFVDGLSDMQKGQGFRMVGAFAPNGALVGFALGATFDADRWWRGADAEPYATMGRPKFAIFELVVDSDWRGQHIATALMSSLVNGQPEPYATLCANPAASARAIYDKWGWTKVGTTRPDGIGEMDILIKPLHT